MQIKLFDIVPTEARNIRTEVFIKEQGFENEFDEIDAIAEHIVVYTNDDTAIGTCRVFQDEKNNYILGRLAVIKEYRGKSIGEQLIKAAEKYVSEHSGKTLELHSQCRASGFYEKMGYEKYGEVEDDEGCPHIWMRKVLDKYNS